MLKYLMAAALVVPAFGGAQAAPQSLWDKGAIVMAQGGIETQSGKPDRRDRPRPQRYYCILDSGSSCPASPGRVGGRCRCPNQTGGGQLVAN